MAAHCDIEPNSLEYKESEADKVLQKGIDENNVDLVRKGIADGAMVHRKFSDIIPEVVMSERTETAKILYDNGAAVMFNLKHPLVAACLKGNEDLINHFFDMGLKEPPNFDLYDFSSNLVDILKSKPEIPESTICLVCNRFNTYRNHK